MLHILERSTQMAFGMTAHSAKHYSKCTWRCEVVQREALITGVANLIEDRIRQ